MTGSKSLETPELSHQQILTLSFLFAFVGLLNEFVFAQTLSAVFGQTHAQYAMTIGLFTMGLGVGSILCDRLVGQSSKQLQILARIQICASIVTLVGCFLILFSEYLIGQNMISRSLSYFPLFIVGILTGFEIPILLRITADNEKSMEIISWDFGGMFVATLFFPFVLLPELGVFSTAFLCALTNLGIAGFLLYKTGRIKTPLKIALGTALILLILAVYKQDLILDLAGTVLMDYL